jgi:hypothetical protein
LSCLKKTEDCPGGPEKDIGSEPMTRLDPFGIAKCLRREHAVGLPCRILGSVLQPRISQVAAASEQVRRKYCVFVKERVPADGRRCCSQRIARGGSCYV